MVESWFGVELSQISFPGAVPAWSFRIQIWLRVDLAWSFRKFYFPERFPRGAFVSFMSWNGSRVELSQILFPGAVPAWSFRIQIWSRVDLAWSFRKFYVPERFPRGAFVHFITAESFPRGAFIVLLPRRASGVEPS